MTKEQTTHKVPVFNLEQCLIGVSVASDGHHTDTMLLSLLYQYLLDDFAKAGGERIIVYTDMENIIGQIEAPFEMGLAIMESVNEFFMSKKVIEKWGKLTPSFRFAGLCSIEKYLKTGEGD